MYSVLLISYWRGKICQKLKAVKEKLRHVLRESTSNDKVARKGISQTSFVCGIKVWRRLKTIWFNSNGTNNYRSQVDSVRIYSLSSWDLQYVERSEDHSHLNRRSTRRLAAPKSSISVLRSRTERKPSCKATIGAVNWAILSSLPKSFS